MKPDIRICVNCENFYKLNSETPSKLEATKGKYLFKCALSTARYMGFYNSPTSNVIYIYDDFDVPTECPWQMEHMFNDEELNESQSED